MLRVRCSEELRLLSKGCKKFFRRYAGLLEYSAKRADFDFAMIWNYAPGRTAPKNDMTASLAKDYKAETLKRADRLRSRDVRQLRHAPLLERWLPKVGRWQ